MKFTTGFISIISGATLLGGIGVASFATSATSAGAATPAVLSAAVSPAPIPATCLGDDGGWPAGVQGVPTGFGAGDSAGVYLWHDGIGWHLRVTHQNDTHQVYTGILVTKGIFSDVDAVKLEHNDSFIVGPDGHTIAYRFNNYGGIDGLNFRTHCADGIGFNLAADGQELNPTEVYIGQSNSNPSSVPFVIHRQG
jgi:hypothetical protein